MEELILYPKRAKWILMILGSLAFVAIGVFIMDGDDGFMRWLVVGFFGLAAVVGIVNLLPTASFLKLDQTGFTFSSLFRKHSVAWKDVLGFGIMSVARNKMVTFETGKSGGMAHLNRTIGGADSALPDTYGMKPDELIELMERYRMAAAANSQ